MLCFPANQQTCINPFGLKSCFTVVVPGFPWNLYTKLTETLRQIKTTFPVKLFFAYMLAWCEKFLFVLHISSAQWRGADPLEQLTTRAGGRMDKMLSVDSPVPDLHGGDQLNTVIIVLCIRSGCAICPAVTYICASLAERPVAGRVCVMNVYLGAQAGHVHAQQRTATHRNPQQPTEHGTYHPAARSLSLLWFELRVILFRF